MKHKSNRQSSRAVAKRGWQKSVGRGEERKENNREQQTSIKCQSNAYLAMRAADKSTTGNKPGANREQTSSKPSKRRRRERGSGGHKMASPFARPIHFKGVATLHSQFAFEIYNWYNAPWLWKQFTLPRSRPATAPASLLPCSPLNWELPHALALNASLTSCPWSGPLRVKRTSFRTALWARCGSTGALAINIFCSIKWTNLMCCHGYMAIYANRWLDWLDRGGWGEGETLSTLAGHSKQDLWQACVDYVGLG